MQLFMTSETENW